MLEYKYFILNHFNHVGLIVLVLIAYHYIFCSSRNKSQICIYLHNHPFVYRLHDGRMTVIFYSRSGEGAKFILLSENGVNLNFRNNMST